MNEKELTMNRVIGHVIDDCINKATVNKIKYNDESIQTVVDAIEDALDLCWKAGLRTEAKNDE